MISSKQEEYLLARAYLPEHIVTLMGIVSKGEPFFIDDCLVFNGDNWTILIGYPLEEPFTPEGLEAKIEKIRRVFGPEYLWFISPAPLRTVSEHCRERETDQYFTLDISSGPINNRLRCLAENAAKVLTVERNPSFCADNLELVEELTGRSELKPRVKALYQAMPEYLSRSKTALVLNARDGQGRLAAFQVIDLAGRDFLAYILGAYSQVHYVPHASDLLFFEMTKISREYDKQTINLGIGVNEGIRRFKRKWGGRVFLGYEFYEYHYPASRTFFLFDQLRRIF